MEDSKDIDEISNWGLFLMVLYYFAKRLFISVNELKNKIITAQKNRVLI